MPLSTASFVFWRSLLFRSICLKSTFHAMAGEALADAALRVAGMLAFESLFVHLGLAGECPATIAFEEVRAEMAKLTADWSARILGARILGAASKDKRMELDVLQAIFWHYQEWRACASRDQAEDFTQEWKNLNGVRDRDEPATREARASSCDSRRSRSRSRSRVSGLSSGKSETRSPSGWRKVSSPCPEAPHSKTFNKKRNKYEEQKLREYRLLYAAEARCLQRMQYWLEEGVDPQATSCEKGVFQWAVGDGVESDLQPEVIRLFRRYGIL